MDDPDPNIEPLTSEALQEFALFALQYLAAMLAIGIFIEAIW